jgi:hypothetical protein
VTLTVLHLEWVDHRASCKVAALENTESANEDACIDAKVSFLGGTCRRERAAIGSYDRLPRSPRPRGVHDLSTLTTALMRLCRQFVTTDLGKTLAESVLDSYALLIKAMGRSRYQRSGDRN